MAAIRWICVHDPRASHPLWWSAAASLTPNDYAREYALTHGYVDGDVFELMDQATGTAIRTWEELRGHEAVLVVTGRGD